MDLDCLPSHLGALLVPSCLCGHEAEDHLCHIPAWANHFSSPLHHRSTILSVLGPDHALTVLFMGTHEQLPSGSPMIGVLWSSSRLTSEFRQNPKPVSSQKASC
ncbi:hypothetical protein DVH24_012359 [Malus domestica]|uniref:Uncharacterized protein n=1 Tax=Malus domestica TaxID=3750 RepID=A0A498HSY6_MALDO|nr:hypothetical protein DVH24_012359 [Malus domestica]